MDLVSFEKYLVIYLFFSKFKWAVRIQKTLTSKSQELVKKSVNLRMNNGLEQGQYYTGFFCLCVWFALFSKNVRNWADEMAKYVKVPIAEPNVLSLFLGPTWWKERTNSCKLFLFLCICAVAPHPSAKINKFKKC